MGHGSAFDPDRDIPSLEGKVILITGGNVGLGKQSALALSKHQPSELWIAARSAKKADSAIAEIKQLSPAVQVRFLELDLASFASVKTATEAFLSSVSRLDILMLNAGIMACPPWPDHGGFGPSGGIQFDTLKSTATAMSTNDRYGQSKLANLLFIRELAEHHPELTVASIHPGTVNTDLQKSNDGSWMINVFQKVVVPLIGVSVEEGAKSQLWAATAKGVQSGEYYVPVGVSGEGSQSSNDKALAKKLWDWTEKELESYI
ncbi:alcohol dehydrogenase Bli-4 [Fusarium napiforme]|uniref:Alcohol dehydrogenase Bli-4 n=1 Tax=Fusarium napiforme TaxID=42672 RepID=A0A8H5JR37_9HYPO|nr:alcohol dehydrogenase Bli-4 [Fusarium napiforme]